MSIASNFDYAKVPATILTGKIIKILCDLGYIYSYTLSNNNYIISLKYINNKPAIRQLFLISTPSKKTYFGWRNMKFSNTNNNIYTNGFIICTTSQGILTDLECAMLHLGGQPLLQVA